MKKLIGILLWAALSYSTAQIISIPIPGSPLSLSIQVNPQPLQNINANPASTVHNLGDDGWANVPLPFKFPFYGKSFDTSTMYSNGAVQFGNPIPAGSWPSGNNSFCCQGMQLNPNLPSGYNYSIMPLWTDLTGYAGNNHYTLATANSMTYGWYNVHQYGTNNANNFEVNINSTGGIDMRWSGALVTMAPVTIGTIGDVSKGEYTQNYYSSTGINIPGLTQLSTGVVDVCLTNPLSLPSCTGYQAAYTSQQCSMSALYDPTCPGYAIAFQNQQCSINPLYATSCPGFQDAYHNQQCSINPLFMSDCLGYAAAFQTKQIADACKASLQPGCANYVAPPPPPVLVATATAPPLAPGISDPLVSAAVTAPSATSVTSVTNVIAPQPPAASPVAAATASVMAPPLVTAPVAAAAAVETKKTDNAVATVEKKSGGNVAEAKKAVATAAKDAAEKSSNATTLEAQTATQGLVVGLMGYVAGFSAYQNAIVPDALAAAVAKQYHKPAVDNRNAQRGLSGASDARWKDIVDSQYNNNKVGD